MIDRPRQEAALRPLVIGGGPSGLGAAMILAKAGSAPVVIERHEQLGGLARTVWFKKHGFDLGPHRFFTKNDEVLDHWKQMLQDDLLQVPRLTRIFYKGKFFAYPLKPFDALTKLGLIRTIQALASYARQKFQRQSGEPENFEDWVIREFGNVLYEIFFKSYTEKVWGIPCDQISPAWAGQRIRGLSLGSAIVNSLRIPGRKQVRSLVEQFHYPRYGAGQLYDVMGDNIVSTGGTLRLGETVIACRMREGRIEQVETSLGVYKDPTHVFASAPITDVALMLQPEPPADVIDAARTLTYRSHITVNVIVDGPSPFPDNWIYIHQPSLKMARVANYNSFSSDLSPAQDSVGLSVEYFCFESDDLWMMDDDELVGLATRELALAELLSEERVRVGFVIREKDSYPTYYLGQTGQFEVLYSYLDAIENLTLIGRAGMYKYNNQDHALLTGLFAARNYLGLSDVDLFSINAEDAYLEEAEDVTRA